MPLQPESWGRYPRSQPGAVVDLVWRSDPLPATPPGQLLLAHACGRSYGDSCLNNAHLLLRTTGLQRGIAFDAQHGILRAEAGITLAAILAMVVPQGWFLPVTPGTRFISLGGAVANDVHGKNQVHAGNFGHYVRQLELLTSDGARQLCSVGDNRQLFAATIGGMGLTGLITWVEIQLQRIPSAWIDAEHLRFANLEEFFALSRASEADYQYTVAWVDCFAQGAQLGRGIFTRGNHAAPLWLTKPAKHLPRHLAVPCSLPQWLLKPLLLQTASTLLYHRQRRARVAQRMHYESFFIPLTALVTGTVLMDAVVFYNINALCHMPTRRRP